LKYEEADRHPPLLKLSNPSTFLFIVCVINIDGRVHMVDGGVKEFVIFIAPLLRNGGRKTLAL
jgi:hypothetical protein